MRAEVHSGGIEPAEERPVRLRLTLDEVDGCGRGLVVDRLHALFRERPGVLDGLLANLAPARVMGRVVAIGGLAAQHTAWTEGFPEPGVARIGARLRIFLGIKVIEIAVEFIEAMDGRQKFVAVAEVVFAELAGRIAKR